MSKQQVNGVTQSGSVSTTLDHFTSYPLVSDLLSYYKSMPLGARSIELSQNIYNQFGKPLISHPIVQNPYSYVHPYAKKADEIGDNTLSQIDANFPAIKNTDLETVKTHASSAIHFPFKVANDSKDYVFSTYTDEYKKTGGEGLVTTGKAVIGTELRIAADTYNMVAGYLGPKKQEAGDELEKLKGAGQDKANKVKKTAEQKKNELTN